jgi:hypothetical protein
MESYGDPERGILLTRIFIVSVDHDSSKHLSRPDMAESFAVKKWTGVGDGGELDEGGWSRRLCAQPSSVS